MGCHFSFVVFFCCSSGGDNLGVVRHVGRLLDGRPGSIPFEFVNDGDLLLLVDRMLLLRGSETVRISKVKGHVDEGMVLDGRVREVDRATTLVMRLLILVVGELVMLSLMLVVIFLVCVVAGTLLFLIFIGSSLPFLEPWFIMMVGMVLRAFLLRPLGIWDSEWISVPASAICAEDTAQWPTLLVFWLNGLPFLVLCIGLLVV